MLKAPHSEAVNSSARNLAQHGLLVDYLGGNDVAASLASRSNTRGSSTR